VQEATARVPSVTLRYVDDCPHWATAYDRLRDALRDEDMAEVEPILEPIATLEDAERLRFRGSPTILIDGRDPFGGVEVFGLSCRVYETPEGLAGSPSVQQLQEALRDATRH
jgi:hypothetical protein